MEWLSLHISAWKVMLRGDAYPYSRVNWAKDIRWYQIQCIDISPVVAPLGIVALGNIHKLKRGKNKN